MFTPRRAHAASFEVFQLRPQVGANFPHGLFQDRAEPFRAFLGKDGFSFPSPGSPI